MKKPVIILAALLIVACLTVGLCAALGVFNGGLGDNPKDSTSGETNGVTTGDDSDTDDNTTGDSSNMAYSKNNYSEGFLDPSAEYRWHYMDHSFASTYEKSVSEFLANLRDMDSTGAGGVVTNIKFSDNYLKDADDFKNLSEAVNLLIKKNNGTFWLYDEYGYPSGKANGLTVEEHPEYIAKGLAFDSYEGNGKNSMTVGLPDHKEILKIHSAYAVDSNGNVLSAKYTDDSATFAGTDGKWTFYVFYEKILFEGTHASNNGNTPAYYPNLMDASAVDEFINNTYKQYAELFTYFDQTVGVFTDEPSLMEVYQNTSDTFKYSQLATVDGFEEKFEEMHGYSIADKYHLIFTGDSDEAKIVRVNYRETVAELISKNYFAKLREFCEANGTKSSGHCLLEESMAYHAYYYGNLMQCLREMSIPGCDGLSMKTDSFMNEGWSIFMACKYASGAANLKGNRMTMMELCAVDLPSDREYNDEEYRNFKTSLSDIMFCGVTDIHSYVGTGMFKSHATELIDYLARISYMSKSAVWDGEVGLYYPIATMQAYTKPSYNAALGSPENGPQMGTVAKTLYKNQLDFTVVDDIFIREATVENGKLTNGKISFSVIMMPQVEVIPLDVMQKLDEFTKGGGKVIWIDRTPDLADKTSETDAVKSLVAGVETVNVDKAVEIAKSSVDYGLKIEKATSTLYVGKYMLEDAPMYWLVNNHDLEKNLTVSYEGAKGFDIYDPETGKITSVSGDTAEVTVGVASTAFVIVRF